MVNGGYLATAGGYLAGSVAIQGFLSMGIVQSHSTDRRPHLVRDCGMYAEAAGV